MVYPSTSGVVHEAGLKAVWLAVVHPLYCVPFTQVFVLLIAADGYQLC